MIHPQAIVDPKAELAADVEVGPFSVIGPGVEIAAGSRIASHVVIKGPTRIGRDNVIHQFASIGDDPQDKKYAGEATRLEIGDRNTVREYVTINRGTVQDQGLTQVGSDNWIMAYVHIAHDCVVGDGIIFANGASLAGHVHVGSGSILGGFALVHQFCRLGQESFLAFASGVRQDVPPFVRVAGYQARAHGINSLGLKRRGYGRPEIRALDQAYRLLFTSGLSRADAVAGIRTLGETHPEVLVMAEFAAASQRGLVRHQRRGESAAAED